MHIITRLRLKEFWKIHANAEASLRKWYKEVSQKDWKNPSDVRVTFNSVDFVHNFVIFNIGGNNYRLIAYIDYDSGKVFIRHVLTHAEYSKKDWQLDPWYN